MHEEIIRKREQLEGAQAHLKWLKATLPDTVESNRETISKAESRVAELEEEFNESIRIVNLIPEGKNAKETYLELQEKIKSIEKLNMNNFEEIVPELVAGETKPGETKPGETKPGDIPVSKDSIKILLDASTGFAQINRRMAGMNTSFSFDLEKLSSSKSAREIRKEFIEKFKEAEDKKYARKIRTLRRKLNPVVLELIKGYDDELDIIRQYINAVVTGKKDELPFDEYDIKLDDGIYITDKAFANLNRYAVRDNKNLGTDFKATPWYTLKKNLIKILPKKLPFVKKAMEALPKPAKESDQEALVKYAEAKGKRENNIEEVDLAHGSLSLKLEIAKRDYTVAKQKLGAATTETEKKQAEAELIDARKKVQQLRDEVVKTDRGPAGASSGYRKFVRKYQTPQPTAPTSVQQTNQPTTPERDTTR